MGFINVFSAIRRPFTNFARLFLGSILLLIPVISLFTMGFIFNCIKDNKELPKWRLRFFIDGLEVLLIVAIYTIPLWIIYGIISLFDMSANSVLVMPFYIIAFLTAYVVPAALVVFAKERQILRGVFSFAFSKKYLLTFFIGLFWAVGLNSISLVLTRVLYWLLPLSLFFIVILLVSMIFLLASQITFVTLISGIYKKT
jgi:hypothetical protein